MRTVVIGARTERGMGSWMAILSLKGTGCLRGMGSEMAACGVRLWIGPMRSLSAHDLGLVCEVGWVLVLYHLQEREAKWSVSTSCRPCSPCFPEHGEFGYLGG